MDSIAKARARFGVRSSTLSGLRVTGDVDLCCSHCMMAAFSYVCPSLSMTGSLIEQWVMGHTIAWAAFSYSADTVSFAMLHNRQTQPQPQSAGFELE